jgi:ankyrin repeat protein
MKNHSDMVKPFRTFRNIQRWVYFPNRLSPVLLPDQWGNTALHIAAANSRLDIVEVLVNAGANVHARDDVSFLD